jgi:mono/diheme cytochrome c family protein
VPYLTGEHARKTSDEDMVDKITNGEDDMPAFNDKLTPQQIQEMVKFYSQRISPAVSKSKVQSPMSVYRKENQIFVSYCWL